VTAAQGRRSQASMRRSKANAVIKDRYLTVGWNNLLTAVLAIPTIAIAIVWLATNGLSNRAGFIWISVLGGLF
jgi:hypothetical protein